LVVVEPKPGMSEIKKSTAVVRLMDFIQEDQHPDLQVEVRKDFFDNFLKFKTSLSLIC
jgi:hypothetical protein